MSPECLCKPLRPEGSRVSQANYNHQTQEAPKAMRAGHTCDCSVKPRAITLDSLLQEGVKWLCGGLCGDLGPGITEALRQGPLEDRHMAP